MKRSPEDLLDEALGALQPFYNEGDDGSSVRLSLDAIAGLLAEHAGTSEEVNLAEALRDLVPDSSLIESVVKLYESARGGEYGAGLSEAQASHVNDEVQQVCDPLRALVLKQLSAKRRRAKKTRPPTKGESR